MDKSEEIFDTIIIGGGPAGLFTALNLKTGKVLLIEKGDRPGRKLLISGTGQCNFTHSGSISDFLKHYGDNHKFLKHALHAFSNKDLIGFFKNAGVRSIEDKNGKIFPESLRSSTILNVLSDSCQKMNVRILKSNPVQDVEYNNSRFRVTTTDEHFSCKNLVISTGGLSYPHTGSTGDGYRFAKKLGHSIIDPRPALTPVIVRNFRMSHLMGISLSDVLISLFREGKKTAEHRGDIVITHKGLSGPGILDFSRYIKEDDTLKINLTGINPDRFTQDFISASQSGGKVTLQVWLRTFNIPKNLQNHLVGEAGTEPNQQIAGIPRQVRLRLAELLCECPFNIEKPVGFKTAMVTAGGVNLTEVSPKTMESKLINNLYFAGEVLNIDGDTGGYNIQAAFSTAFLAANAINSITEQ